MPFEIPDNLAPNLMGVAWMIGRWEGNGHGSWPDRGDFTYGQTVEFTQNGSDYLHYISQIYDVDDEDRPVRAISMETGFWRPKPDGTVDVVLAQPEGHAEVWYGSIEGAKIELTTDAIMAAKDAPAYTGGHRLYGNVESDLLWAFDKATPEVALQPYLWARLQRAA